MKLVRLRYIGTRTYYGQDERRSASLTCEPGVIAEVCEAKAEELLGSPDWTLVDPKPSAGSAGVPGGDGKAASSSAVNTGDPAQKSDGAPAAAGADAAAAANAAKPASGARR